ncbi:hypothetical protein HispidOSU_005889, partial [Sigmodon hispidus]
GVPQRDPRVLEKGCYLPCSYEVDKEAAVQVICGKYSSQDICVEQACHLVERPSNYTRGFSGWFCPVFGVLQHRHPPIPRR